MIVDLRTTKTEKLRWAAVRFRGLGISVAIYATSIASGWDVPVSGSEFIEMYSGHWPDPVL